MTALLEVGALAAMLIGLAFVGYLLRTDAAEAINRKDGE